MDRADLKHALAVCEAKRDELLKQIKDARGELWHSVSDEAGNPIDRTDIVSAQDKKELAAIERECEEIREKIKKTPG